MAEAFSSSLDEYYMALALAEAQKAALRGEVPVGAVVVCEERIMGRGYNRREIAQDPMAHAEIEAMREAARGLASWRLSDCVLYVTLEPCIMCVGAALQARISRIVYGCADPKGGAVESLYRLCEDARLNHHPSVTRGVLEEKCSQVLTDFFARLRESKREGMAGKVDINTPDVDT